MDIISVFGRIFNETLEHKTHSVIVICFDPCFIKRSGRIGDIYVDAFAFIYDIKIHVFEDNIKRKRDDFGYA